MKIFLKLAAAVLAICLAVSCLSAASFADKLKTVDGVRYVYYDNGKVKGKFSGWDTAKNGAKYYYNNGILAKNSWLKDNGVRTFYVDENGKAVVGNYTLNGVDYYFDSDARLVYGISARCSNVTQNGMTLLLGGEALNNSKVEAWTSEEYYIERMTPSGGWEKLNTISKKTNWSSKKIYFFNGGKLVQHTDQIDWSKLYGTVSNGSYRLCKEYSVKIDPAAKTVKKTLYAPFSIKLYDSAEIAWGVSLSVSSITTDSITVILNQTTGHTGYVEYDSEYIIEQQDSKGNWNTVDKTAYDKAVKNGEFSGSSGRFGNIKDPKASEPGGSVSWNCMYYCGELPVGHYRIKKNLNGNCDGIKGKMITTTEFDILNSTPNGWGIGMSMSGDSCESGGTLCIEKTVQNGTVSGNVWTDEAYTLEKLSGDSWKTINPIGNENRNGVGITLRNGKRSDVVLNWEKLYGKQSTGTYRIGKIFYAKNNETGKTIEKTMFAEFVIGEGGVNIGSYDLKITNTKLNKGYISFSVTRSGKYKGSVSWDGSFEIQQKNSSGKWKVYKGKTALDMESDEAEDFPNGKTCKTGLYINSVYPELQTGTYRLKIKVQDQTYHIKYFYAQFTVK